MKYESARRLRSGRCPAIDTVSPMGCRRCEAAAARMYRRLFVSIVEKSLSQARACCCHCRHNEQEYEHDCKCNDDCSYKQCSKCNNFEDNFDQENPEDTAAILTVAHKQLHVAASQRHMQPVLSEAERALHARAFRCSLLRNSWANQIDFTQRSCVCTVCHPCLGSHQTNRRAPVSRRVRCPRVFLRCIKA